MKEKHLTHIEDLLKMLEAKAPSDLCGSAAQAGYAYAITQIIHNANEYRGKWIHAINFQYGGGGKWRPTTSTTICSACHSEAYWSKEWGTHLFKYCPFCGAWMNKEE